jgi:hypothetical protein
MNPLKSANSSIVGLNVGHVVFDIVRITSISELEPSQRGKTNSSKRESIVASTVPAVQRLVIFEVLIATFSDVSSQKNNYEEGTLC